MALEGSCKDDSDPTRDRQIMTDRFLDSDRHNLL